MNTKRRLLAYVAAAAPGIGLSVHLTGCSLIGLGIGHMADQSGFDHTAARFTRVRTGTNVEFRHRDGTVHKGRLEGLGVQDTAEYRPRYREWRRYAPYARVPQIDDSVEIITLGRGRWPGRLAGFGVGTVTIADSNGHSRQFSVYDIAQVRAGGATHGREALTALLQTGTVPLMTTITLSTSYGARTFAGDEIAYVMAPGPSGGKTTGFLVGLTVDVLLVAAASQASNSSSSSYSGCQSSESGSSGFWGYSRSPVSSQAEAQQAGRVEQTRIVHPHPRIENRPVVGIPVGASAQPGLAAERSVVVIGGVDERLRIARQRGYASRGYQAEHGGTFEVEDVELPGFGLEKTVETVLDEYRCTCRFRSRV